MAELDLGVFLRRIDHEGIEITERGRKKQRGAVDVDHRLHRLRHRHRFRHILFFDHLDAGNFLQGLRADRMGLVPAIILARPDIDDADGDIGGAGRASDAGNNKRTSGGATEKRAAGKRKLGHGQSP